jgi:hypothetical protein
MNYRKTALAVAAVAAIVPAAALGAPSEHANEHALAPHGNPNASTHGVGPAKGVAYVFKGTYAGDSTVSVTKGNNHVRKAGLVDSDVAFDLSAAKLSVDDTNGDSAVTLDDVAIGDKVVVKAKLPKGDPGVAPYAARQLVDQTHPADADDEETVVEEPVEPSGE